MAVVAPATGPALIILVAFVLPGFVTVLLQERTFKSAEDPTPFDRLLRTVYYSVWCYLLLAVVALVFGVSTDDIVGLYDRYDGDGAQLVWRGALAVLIPALVVAEATRWWEGSDAQDWVRKKLRINGRHRVPSGWDHFFAQGLRAPVRVTMKDGSQVLGYYGGDSFAAYSKDGGDLFLEAVYEATDDGGFGDAKPHCGGVWIKASDAVAMEVYASSDDDPEKHDH